MTAPTIVEQHDPADLLTDANISDRRPDTDLIESIRDIGVLQPIIATRTADGHVRVRMGHRRTFAAIEAGRDTVPVIVVADEADYADPADAALDRIIAQFSENEHRLPLTAADKAGVAVQLLDLGLSARQVTARTRMRPADVEQARAIRGSAAAARAVIDQPQLTIEQAAAIAEFEDDLTVVDALVDAAADGHGKFAHTLQRHRDERELAAVKAGLIEKLTADGITITDTRPDWDNRLEYLTTAGDKKLTPSGHKKCPGHIAYIGQQWGEKPADRWAVIYSCTDPKANGHKSTRSSGSTVDPETAKQERRETIARNKEWRAAEQVRRAWLREFLTSKTAPAGALRYVLAAIADASGVLSRAMSQSHECARELLGLPEPESKWHRDTAAITEALSRAPDGRALVIVLGLALGAIEGETGVQTAVHPASQGTAAAYLGQLAGWGYGLSGIEQRVVDAVADARAARDAEAAAAAAGDGA